MALKNCMGILSPDDRFEAPVPFFLPFIPFFSRNWRRRTYIVKMVDENEG